MKIKTSNRETMKSLDDIRYEFNWLELSKDFPELNDLSSASDDAFLMDERITNDNRQCRVIFLKNGEKIGHFTFMSGYGRDFIEDFISSKKTNCTT